MIFATGVKMVENGFNIDKRNMSSNENNHQVTSVDSLFFHKNFLQSIIEVIKIAFYVFFLIMICEIGDKSQMNSIYHSYKLFISFSAIVLVQIIFIGLAVLGGSIVSSHISEKSYFYLFGIILVLFAIISIYFFNFNRFDSYKINSENYIKYNKNFLKKDAELIPNKIIFNPKF
jgi:putative Ca2+/H+ antiporter (TMEM165/GDT1 family)